MYPSVTRDALSTCVAEFLDRIVADPRWDQERDDLGVTVAGILAYGFALAARGTEVLVDTEDVEAAVLKGLTERMGAAPKWSGGLVAEAKSSAVDPDHHPGHHELIGVGRSYFGVTDHRAIVNNVFANIASVRQHS
jgi:hypothetical protein